MRDTRHRINPHKGIDHERNKQLHQSDRRRRHADGPAGRLPQAGRRKRQPTDPGRDACASRQQRRARSATSRAGASIIGTSGTNGTSDNSAMPNNSNNAANPGTNPNSDNSNNTNNSTTPQPASGK